MTMKHISSNINNKRWQPTSNPFEGLPIRPKLKKERLWIDNEYFANGYAAAFPKATTLVYGVLAKYANADTQRCFPAWQTLMKETGIKNRRTISEAIRILEAFGIIAVVHSTGKYPNRYVLLDAQQWKKADSGIVATVRKAKKHRVTVAKDTPQQYQTELANSGTDDTRNHINESDKEIIGTSAKKKDDEPTKAADDDASLLNRLGGFTRKAVLDCYRETDVIAALRAVEVKEGSVGLSELNAALRRVNAKPFQKPRFPVQ